MKKTYRLALIGAKVWEISHWISAGAWLCILVITLVFGQQAFHDTALGKVFATSVTREGWGYTYQKLNLYGLSVMDTDKVEHYYVHPDPDDDTYQMRQTKITYRTDAIIAYGVGCMFLMILMALIFNNVYRILKAAKTDRSPFQKKIAKSVHRIGLYLIGMSVICIVTSIIAGTITGTLHLCLGIQHTILGIFVLCLSEYFRHGIRLEQDAEGLI